MTQLAFSTFFPETKMPELIVLSSTDSGMFSFIKMKNYFSKLANQTYLRRPNFAINAA
jgi:hypothetical protein